MVGNYGCSFVLVYKYDGLELFSATGTAANFTGKDVLQELNSMLKSKECFPTCRLPAVSTTPLIESHAVRNRSRVPILALAGLAGMTAGLLISHSRRAQSGVSELIIKFR